ncbi:MAG: M14 family metallopeptidase [Burkholderiales bacterium]|nr:M14 family metallopeptidase [Burkholderiales bacterium]
MKQPYFAASYADARARFIAAAEAAGLELHSHPHPLVGRDGEALALDLARSGPPDAQALLVISSGCHGVEGFCGSGVQGALLADAQFQREAREAGVALLYLHALNPWGFSWWRRTTHENVDLNRNFRDFSQPLAPNPGYDELAHFLVPATWPPTPENEAAIMGYALRHGERALQTAISAGQHEHPQGIFYCGRNPTWSQQVFRHVLQEEARRCARLGWIDLHTGLGSKGVGERILNLSEADRAGLARARAWWGPGVTSIYDGSSTSARLSGMMFEAVYQECPQAEFTSIALEYGTLPLQDVMAALRADQWLENHPEAGAAQSAAIKQRVKDAFFCDEQAWMDAVVTQGVEAAHQAVAGLRG